MTLTKTFSYLDLETLLNILYHLGAWKMDLYHLVAWKMDLYHLVAWKMDLYHLVAWKMDLYHLVAWKMDLYHPPPKKTRCWFQIFFYFPPYLGKMNPF